MYIYIYCELEHDYLRGSIAVNFRAVIKLSATWSSFTFQDKNFLFLLFFQIHCFNCHSSNFFFLFYPYVHYILSLTRSLILSRKLYLPLFLSLSCSFLFSFLYLSLPVSLSLPLISVYLAFSHSLWRSLSLRLSLTFYLFLFPFLC